ncbi:MAG: hypothetical protein IJJ44_10355 [Solobacterium sp.]|nr:hypothetical protein [Solobacterium sp.]
MKNYGVIDIGSNTIVLLIYSAEKKLKILYHESQPVHLIQYVQNGHMQEEGILRACEVLSHYREVCTSYILEDLQAFITEPWRNIDNAEDMLRRFRNHVPVTALSGREEAELDYQGSLLDCADILSGNACDIGGGSTEFICFRNHRILEAVSIPYGCVRLSVLPVAESFTDPIVQKTLHEYPGLTQEPSDTLVGIGGTCRAAGKMAEVVYGTKQTHSLKDLERIYTLLQNQDPEMTAVMKNTVSAGRQSVFLPGLNMLLSVMHAYHAQYLRVSKGCVREGFLLKYMLPGKEQR